MLTHAEYCEAMELGEPKFHSEKTFKIEKQYQEDHGRQLRIWITVGELRLELNNEKYEEEESGTEKLAGRVLKHLLKQHGQVPVRQEPAQASTSA